MTNPGPNLRDRTFALAVAIVRFCRLLQKNRNYWAIADQLIRAGMSIGANVREARSAASKREFAHFYDIALKSANETCYWLELIAAVTDDSDIKAEAHALHDEAEIICRVLAKSLKTMRFKS